MVRISGESLRKLLKYSWAVPIPEMEFYKAFSLCRTKEINRAESRGSVGAACASCITDKDTATGARLPRYV